MLISSVYPEPSLFLTLPVDLRSGRSGKGSAFKHGDTDLAEDSADKWHCWHYFVLDLLHTYPASSLLFHRACASSSRLTWNIWCQFHLSIYFSLEVFVQKYKRMQISGQKRRQKNDPYLRRNVFYISSLWSTYKAQIQVFLAFSRADLLSSFSTHSRHSSRQQFKTIQSTASL